MVATTTHERFAVSEVRCHQFCTGAGADCAYRVAWKINPHMQIGASCLSRAQMQHAALVSALRLAGAEVLSVPFVHGGFDSVFIKDNAVLVEQQGVRRALMTRPYHSQRAVEQDRRSATLGAKGFHVHRVRGAHFEGGDVVMLPNNEGAILGVGPRSAVEAAKDLGEFLQQPVVTVELCDPFLYHLDTALTVLSDGTALACREAFTQRGWAQLKSHWALTRVIAMPRHEALRLTLNMVEVGSRVIIGAASPIVEACLSALGREPVVVDLSEFILAGGSAACLVSRIHLDRRQLVAQAA